MQKAASSIGSLEQALYNQFTPTFAKLIGSFISSIDKKQAEKNVIQKHLFEHPNNLKHLKRRYKITNELLKLPGKVILRILMIDFCNSLPKSDILQLKTKNNKMLFRRPKHANKTSQVPVKNLSDYDIDTSSLKYGSHHSFIHKKKFSQRDFAFELESLVKTVDELVTPEQKGESHEFLQHITELLSQNAYYTKDNTFKETHKIRNNNNVVILPGDKDSSVIIMNRSDYTKMVHQCYNKLFQKVNT